MPTENLTFANRTHLKSGNSFEDCVMEIRRKIVSRGDMPHASVDCQLEILNGLSAFPLGRFIIARGGANGFWTDYMVSYPLNGKIAGINIEGKPLSKLEDFLLNKCPVVVAHQERFCIFQKLLQTKIQNHTILASVPCGVMRDLLTLDFSHITNVELIGIDIDIDSLVLAQQLARKKKIENVRFLHKDAWEMDFQSEIDVITSSGLNVYEDDPQKVLKLYEFFFSALKPGGSLIISALTYPPGEERYTDWDLEKLSPEILLMDRIVHKDILDVKWRNFRAICELESEFKKVGFSDISVYFDRCRIFPTILAKKPCFE